MNTFINLILFRLFSAKIQSTKSCWTSNDFFTFEKTGPTMWNLMFNIVISAFDWLDCWCDQCSFFAIKPLTKSWYIKSYIILIGICFITEIQAAINRLLVIYTKIMDRVVIMRNRITYILGVNYSTETTQTCYILFRKCS